MIVSHVSRFIFLKTRKTAGTSVEIALSRFSGPDNIIAPILPQDEAIRRALGLRGPLNYRVDHGAVDFVGCYDRLNDDLSEIVERLGLPEQLELPEAKSGHRPEGRHYRDLLETNAQTRIEVVCEREPRYFGYAG